MYKLLSILLLTCCWPLAILPAHSETTDNNRSVVSVQFEYEYADGAGNRHLIDRQSIDYRPISRLESSSGIYDGGTAKRVKIDTQQYQTISTTLDRAFKLKSSRVAAGKGRAKGTGMISKPDRARRLQSRILEMNSPARQQIEALLQQTIATGVPIDR
jgi:hypothetical protein